MANEILDGKHAIGPTAFDAHEQIVRGPHKHSRLAGYQPAPPTVTLDEKGDVKTAQEFPKVIKRGDENWTVYSAEQEKAVAAMPEYPKEILVRGEKWTVYSKEQETDIRAAKVN
jgi:hypothetical protein